MKDLTQGSIKKHLLLLAVPLLIGNVLQQTYNTMDAFVIGRFAGTAEFSAVGVASSVMNLLLFIIVGACTGVSIIFSEQYGGKREAEFRTEHFTALLLGGVAALVLCLISNIFLTSILRLTQTPSEILPYAACYLRIVLCGLPFAFLYNLYSALLRSTGNTKATLYILLVSTLINLVLDLWMVGSLRMGIAGAAWATFISQMLSAVLSFLYFRRLLPHLLFRRADVRLNKWLVRKTLRFSLATAIQQASLYIGKIMIQSAVNACGTELIAAFTAATRIEGYLNSFGDSGGVAASVMIAQNLGAGREERIKKTFRNSLVLLFFIGVCCSALLYLFSGHAVSLILGQTDGNAFGNAAAYLRIISLFYTFCFTGNAFAGYLKGRGYVYVSFMGTAGHISLRAVFTWIFIKEYQLPSVALASGIGWVLVNLFWTFFLWRKAKKDS